VHLLLALIGRHIPADRADRDALLFHRHITTCTDTNGVKMSEMMESLFTRKRCQPQPSAT
jgi:hypothetical protein